MRRLSRFLLEICGRLSGTRGLIDRGEFKLRFI